MRLIDADALFELVDGIARQSESIKFEDGHIRSVDVLDLITNAPKVEGEPVYQAREINDYMWRDCNTGWFKEYLKQPEYAVRVLYTVPPQPQSVKDALEKVANICKEIANRDSSSQIGVVSAFDCEEAIRTLIKKD